MLTKPPALTEGPNGLMSSATFGSTMVDRVFENIGGEEKLTEMAMEDPKWFMEKFFTKRILPEKQEVQRDKSIAEIVAEIDALNTKRMIDVTPQKVGKASVEPDDEFTSKTPFQD